MRGLCGDRQVGHRRPRSHSAWTKVRAARLLLHLLPGNTIPSLMAGSGNSLGSDLVALASAMGTSGHRTRDARRHRGQERSASVGHERDG